ncbi:hypothetical protein CIT31_29200 [Mesorhizobium wenxiniae]|uniref:Uncharacterized protein n=1 Tax=Mesorhizobium wenxiniae TaxID=2014805 RepID=A0A271K8K3_9HYPH|nr:hypothetical protein CIT31_29200 [Mesorhizobium wenxiniae]
MQIGQVAPKAARPLHIAPAGDEGDQAGSRALFTHSSFPKAGQIDLVLTAWQARNARQQAWAMGRHPAQNEHRRLRLQQMGLRAA